MTGVINDPLGKSHSTVIFAQVLTPTVDNSDHSRLYSGLSKYINNQVSDSIAHSTTYHMYYVNDMDFIFYLSYQMISELFAVFFQSLLTILMQILYFYDIP